MSVIVNFGFELLFFLELLLFFQTLSNLESQGIWEQGEGKEG